MDEPPIDEEFNSWQDQTTEDTSAWSDEPTQPELDLSDNPPPRLTNPVNEQQSAKDNQRNQAAEQCPQKNQATDNTSERQARQAAIDAQTIKTNTARRADNAKSDTAETAADKTQLKATNKDGLNNKKAKASIENEATKPSQIAQAKEEVREDAKGGAESVKNESASKVATDGQQAVQEGKGKAHSEKKDKKQDVQEGKGETRNAEATNTKPQSTTGKTAGTKDEPHTTESRQEQSSTSNATTSDATASKEATNKKNIRKTSSSEETPGAKSAPATEGKGADQQLSVKNQEIENSLKSVLDKDIRKEAVKDPKDTATSDQAARQQGSVKIFRSATSAFTASSDADIDALRQASQRTMDTRQASVKESKQSSGETGAAVLARQMAQAASKQSPQQTQAVLEQRISEAQTAGLAALKDIPQALSGHQSVIATSKGGGGAGSQDMSGMFGGAFSRLSTSSTTASVSRQAAQTSSTPYTDFSTLNTVKELMNRLQFSLKDATIDKSNFSLNIDTAQMGKIKLTVEERNDTLNIRVEVKGDSNKEQLSQNKEELAGEARKFGYRQVNVDVSSSGGEGSGSHPRARQEGNDNFDNVRLPGREEFDFAAFADTTGKDFLETARTAVAAR